MSVFVDTNVWVYAVDGADAGKQSRAQSVLLDLAPTDIVISAQVLSEYHVTVTRKLAVPLSPDESSRALRAMSEFDVVPITAGLVHSAVDRERGSVLSFWDALIVEAARAARCEVLLTEDLNDGQGFEGLEVRDPFS